MNTTGSWIRRSLKAAALAAAFVVTGCASFAGDYSDYHPAIVTGGAERQGPEGPRYYLDFAWTDAAGVGQSWGGYPVTQREWLLFYIGKRYEPCVKQMPGQLHIVPCQTRRVSEA